jgi:hypothetical protein
MNLISNHAAFDPNLLEHLHNTDPIELNSII